MQVSLKVQRVMEAEKISAAELSHMVKRAAISRDSSNEGFNKRYFHWLFRIKGDLLEDMRYVNLVEVGHGESSVFEEHEPCEGDGCRACGWIGEIIRRVDDNTSRSIQRHI